MLEHADKIGDDFIAAYMDESIKNHAGLCAMLASLMLALVVQPWLAWFAGSPNTDATAAGKD